MLTSVVYVMNHDRISIHELYLQNILRKVNYFNSIKIFLLKRTI